MKRFILMVYVAFMLMAPSAVYAAIYDVDKDHTTIGFSAKHMVISNVKGKFDSFTGNFELNEQGKLIGAAATVKTGSINTGNAKRDTHLKSPDFFDAVKFPVISFKATKITYDGAKCKVVGDMTIKGVTKSITLDGELLGRVKDPWGFERAGFHAEGVINRKDFGVSFHKVLDNGGLVVSDMINISLDIEGIKRKPGK